jgi:hypothetical protein
VRKGSLEAAAAQRHDRYSQQRRISHNEIEDAKPEHITAGCNVLLHAMLERAKVV